MNKKYFIIIGTVVGLIIIGLIIFWITRPATPAPGAGTNGAFPADGKKVPVGTTTPGTIVNPPPTIIQPGQQRPLVQLTQKAISGATSIEKIQADKTKTGMVRYFEKATGHSTTLTL